MQLTYTPILVNVLPVAREKNPAGRRIIRIAITEGAKDAVEKIADAYDMTEFGVASRVYEWFGRQPPEVQKWVMGLYTGIEGDGIRLFAEELLNAQAPPDIRSIPLEQHPAGARGKPEKPPGRSPGPAGAKGRRD